MWHFAPILFIIHSLALLIDEVWFHRRRGLPVWERWGHPLDTLTVLACYGLAFLLPVTELGLTVFAGAAIFSCLFVTKDEWIHARYCSGGEMWLHSCLFLFHPILLGIVGVWKFYPLSNFHPFATKGHEFFGTFLAVQIGLTALCLAFQIIYWNGPWKPALPTTP